MGIYHHTLSDKLNNIFLTDARSNLSSIYLANKNTSSSATMIYNFGPNWPNMTPTLPSLLLAIIPLNIKLVPKELYLLGKKWLK